MRECERAKNYPNGLNAPDQKSIQRLTILPGYGYVDWATCHVPKDKLKTFYVANVLLELIQAVKNLALRVADHIANVEFGASRTDSMSTEASGLLPAHTSRLDPFVAIGPQQ